MLKGMQTNLYKCFLPQAWMVGAPGSVAGFLHPEGIYDDQKEENLGSRSTRDYGIIFNLENERILFPIGGTRRYGINIF